MKSCEEWQSQIEAYLDDALVREEKQRFEAHISSCSECKEALRFARSIREALSDMPDIEIPDDFCESVHKRIATETGVRRGLGTYAKRYGALAACVILAVVIKSGVSWFEFADKDTLPEESLYSDTVSDTQQPTQQPIVLQTEDMEEDSGKTTPTNEKTADTAELEKNNSGTSAVADAAKSEQNTKEALSPEKSTEPVQNIPSQEPQQTSEAPAEPGKVMQTEEGTGAISSGQQKETQNIESRDRSAEQNLSETDKQGQPAAANYIIEEGQTTLPPVLGAQQDVSLEQTEEKVSSGGGGGSSAAMYSSTNSIAELVVSQNDVIETEQVALKYAERLEDGSFRADADSYAAFLNHLDSIGIEYSESAESSLNIVFTIRSR